MNASESSEGFLGFLSGGQFNMTSHSRCAKDSVSLPNLHGSPVNASEGSEGFLGFLSGGQL